MQRVILAVGYHDREAPRHWNICKELRGKGYEVRECHTTRRGFIGKCVDLWRQFREKSTGVSEVLVTFPGHYLVSLAWLLTRIPRRQLTFDAFLSLWDSLVDDRRLVSRWNPYSWFLWFVDYVSTHLADEVLLDTEAHRKFFIERFHLKPEHVHVVYLGTREDLFIPATEDGGQRTENRGRCEVLFYGTYIPLQGVESIIDAARLLQESHPQIHFTLVGAGQTYPATRALAEKYKLTNVTFKPPVPFRELPGIIRTADLCLGIFGRTAKARRVIPHKVYDAVGCGVPIVTSDTPAIREKFAHHPLVHFCKAGNPQDLAEKIIHFYQHQQ
jgi:glycosyltransferase involved in cell wall biosynthesis